MKTLLQYLRAAEEKANKKIRKEANELLSQYTQKMYSDGDWKVKRMKRKRLN